MNVATHLVDLFIHVGLIHGARDAIGSADETRGERGEALESAGRRERFAAMDDIKNTKEISATPDRQRI